MGSLFLPLSLAVSLALSRSVSVCRCLSLCLSLSDSPVSSRFRCLDASMSVATGTLQQGPVTCSDTRRNTAEGLFALSLSRPRSLALVLPLSPSLSLLLLKTGCPPSQLGCPLRNYLSSSTMGLLLKTAKLNATVSVCAVRRSSGTSSNIYRLTRSLSLSLQVSRSRAFTTATRARSSEKRPRTVQEDRVGSLSCL